MFIASQSLLIHKSMKTLKINPVPSDATVTLTSSVAGYTQVGNSITVPHNATVTYVVTATDYTTQSGTVVMSESKTLNITLVYHPYEPGSTIINNPTVNTEVSFTLKVSGYYTVTCHGGGGGCMRLPQCYNPGTGLYPTGSYFNNNGGAGGAYKATVYLNAGEYTCKRGGGGSGRTISYCVGSGYAYASDGADSWLKGNNITLISTGYGAAGRGDCWQYRGNGGNGGVSSDSSLIVRSVDYSTVGGANNGGSGNGGSGGAGTFILTFSSYT